MRITEAASLPPLPPIDLHQCSGRCYCACYACCYSREEDAPVGQVKGRSPTLQKLAEVEDETQRPVPQRRAEPQMGR